MIQGSGGLDASELLAAAIEDIKAASTVPTKTDYPSHSQPVHWWCEQQERNIAQIESAIQMLRHHQQQQRIRIEWGRSLAEKMDREAVRFAFGDVESKLDLAFELIPLAHQYICPELFGTFSSPDPPSLYSLCLSVLSPFCYIRCIRDMDHAGRRR